MSGREAAIAEFVQATPENERLRGRLRV